MKCGCYASTFHLGNSRLFLNFAFYWPLVRAGLDKSRFSHIIRDSYQLPTTGGRKNILPAPADFIRSLQSDFLGVNTTNSRAYPGMMWPRALDCCNRYPRATHHFEGLEDMNSLYKICLNIKMCWVVIGILLD